MLSYDKDSRSPNLQTNLITVIISFSFTELLLEQIKYPNLLVNKIFINTFFKSPMLNWLYFIC